MNRQPPATYIVGCTRRSSEIQDELRSTTSTSTSRSQFVNARLHSDLYVISGKPSRSSRRKVRQASEVRGERIDQDNGVYVCPYVGYGYATKIGCLKQTVTLEVADSAPACEVKLSPSSRSSTARWLIKTGVPSQGFSLPYAIPI